ncbi:hypothetical protein DBR06_SOUSAS8510006 [Sousa chinensis]|nr:hypothetical protein DBR06_SOUSAS8510006 [Sousa chinensis]
MDRFSMKFRSVSHSACLGPASITAWHRSRPPWLGDARGDSRTAVDVKKSRFGQDPITRWWGVGTHYD